MKITGKNASMDYEDVTVEFVKRETDGSGEVILTAPAGEKAKLSASFAGPGGAHTTAPEEIFIREIIEGRDEFPYLWTL